VRKTWCRNESAVFSCGLLHLQWCRLIPALFVAGSFSAGVKYPVAQLFKSRQKREPPNFLQADEGKSAYVPFF
jgi:hypothetical protein